MNINKYWLIICIIIAVAAFFAGRLSNHTLIPQTQTESKTNTPGVISAALATCLAAADSHYQDAWNNLCATDGKASGCNEFIGSPKDIQFSQVKNQEKETCANLYK